jgi:hypothetical protein
MADDARPVRSYLWNTFTKIDWIIVGGMIVTLLGAIWFVVDLTIAAETALIRADLRMLGDEIEDARRDLHVQFGDLSTALRDAEARLVEALDAFSTDLAKTMERWIARPFCPDSVTCP